MENLKKHIDEIAKEAKKVFRDYPQVSKIVIDTDDTFLSIRVLFNDLNKKGGDNE